ncbi:hypothetical protein ABKN59_005166 [Abortiporus biennis]
MVFLIRVLVTGATGFIGFPVAQALAKQLHTEELTPIIGEYLKPSPCLVATLDVVINAVGAEVRLKDRGIKIRPGLLYGFLGSLTAALLSQAKEGNVIKDYGAQGRRLGTVHTDDLANLYLLAAEKAQLVEENTFSGVNDATESIDDTLQSFVAISGRNTHYPDMERFETLLCTLKCTTLIYIIHETVGFQRDIISLLLDTF